MFEKRKILSLAAALILGGLHAAAAAALGESQDIGRDVDRLLKEREFSGSLLIAKKGTAVYKTAAGFADPQRKVPLTTRSSFNLASVSKQFTAAAVMILFERGRVRLDDPAADYLPELAYAQGISIRHLLNHTAGLPDIYNLLETGWDKSKIAGNEEFLKIFAGEKPGVLFKPGEKMEYSNTGYIMLASIVEKVSGLPLNRFLAENIFVPLEMKDSFVYYRTLAEFPGAERVYGLRSANGVRSLDDLIYCDGTRGDGNVYSSVEDLFKWDRALYGEKLLRKETIRLMFTPGRLNNGASTAYGFGFGLSEQGRVVSHGGAWVGFRSMIIRYLDRKDTFIMLMNGHSPKTAGIMDEVKNKFFPTRP